MTDDAARAWTVLDEEAGRRVDVFLRDKLDGVGRAKLKNALENGLVRVNGRRVKKGVTVAAGDKVELELEDLTGSALADPAVALDVVYEDAALVVVNKPAGVPTQPLRIGEMGTVANGLLARYPEMAGVGYEAREPGILHRLDVDTSGLLLAARNAAVFEVLRNLLAAGGIEKEYQALVGGSMRAPQTIPYAIATDPTSATRSARRTASTPSPVVATEGRASSGTTRQMRLAYASPMKSCSSSSSESRESAWKLRRLLRPLVPTPVTRLAQPSTRSRARSNTSMNPIS